MARHVILVLVVSSALTLSLSAQTPISKAPTKATPATAAKKAPPATIEVGTAAYGLNAAANQAGNATEYVKAACNGKVNCPFQIQDAAGKIGDKFPGVKK